MSKLTTQEAIIGCIIAVPILLASFCGVLWCEGYVIINGVNYLSQKNTLPATHTGYLFSGLIFTMLCGAIKGRKGSSD